MTEDSRRRSLVSLIGGIISLLCGAYYLADFVYAHAVFSTAWSWRILGKGLGLSFLGVYLCLRRRAARK